jgi:hypothetical protein
LARLVPIIIHINLNGKNLVRRTVPDSTQRKVSQIATGQFCSQEKQNFDTKIQNDI